MIPLKLILKNFLSYGDNSQEVNFEPYSLICLSGKNGHGKSALLDAITWALWGQARKIGGVSRSDEALIRLGQQEMCVVFDFMCNQQRYTVRRELSFYHGKAKVVLDLGYFHESEQKLVPLTEKTVRLTQEKIDQVIGLNFETFVSSVFLRQGQSNEFSKKSAKERKDVLAAILGLEYYDHVRRYVMDRARSVQSDVEHAIAHQERLRSNLEKMGEMQQEARSSVQNLQEVAFQEDIILNRQKEIKKERELLFQKREHFFVLDKQFACVHEHIQKLKHEHELRFEQQRKELEIVGARLFSKKELLYEQTKNLHIQKKNYEQEFQELTLQKKKCEDATRERDECENKFKGAHSLFEKRKELYHRMIGYGNWVKQEMHTIKEHDLTQIKKNDPICPLCECLLPSERQQFLKNKLDKRCHFYEHRVTRISRFITESKMVLIDEHKKLEYFNHQLNQLVQEASRKKEIEERCAIVEKGVRELVQSLKKFDDIYGELQKDEEALQAQKKVHEEKIFDDLKNSPEYQKLNDLLQTYEQQRKLVDEESLKMSDLQLRKQEQVLDQELQIIMGKKGYLLQEKGRLEQMMVQHEKMKIELTDGEKKIMQQQTEIEDYKALVAALGKDGIQALLIESVIPEIESEANMLLAQLSDQNAQIFIESVRDLKSGGAKETLDIKISDNAGIRPYELFSGGEAFRIDFALRIAISTLLARRAGTSLQTLIIDEGFGSQDADGLQLIMEALYKIQDRFAKIIIVSHLPELRDQFPVHFLVEKTATGSQVFTIEHG
ncbi:TPA: hypothetical protein DIC20_02190 [Candidatus Dependentiae bacterium]|nr:MAG: SMC domain protein [candidate division TM6 bacterium GW2011_GWF2_36_131]KKQ03047.1 MAG: SMC domain protein [candidate division TM6 bacterium GW2011_GWE2_36_25]KKQ19614.1 MAG: SMC domain protein [candidate division TM6 bacterium GW2011_GWA2_36_9]HBR71129.1 hypothetical protein [Candidatus Dependentiae bacterium]HCU00494.1 hypothetical protein [Candidatus Dependentiae bacterium]